MARHPRALPSALLALGLLGLVSPPAASQSVQGRLLDRDSAEPVDGALVLLLTVEGEEVVGYLTNQAGRYLLEAPGPGRYTLRAERIGYETATSQPFDLTRGQLLHLDLSTAFAAIQLDEIKVEGEQQCVVRPGEGMEVARVWDEARKALSVQEWTEEAGFYTYRIANYTRELDPQALTVLSENRRVTSATTQNPIRSLPAENLLENGFIRKLPDGGYEYFGADARVLLSDLFLDTHCFRLREDPREPGVVGLGFEPARRSSTPDIEGSLWLDRETGKLRSLEYTYTWSPWEAAIGVGRGRVDFEEMPNGAWIIRRWWIRMPKGSWDRNLLSGERAARVVGLTERGGEVTDISTLDRQVVRASSRGWLSGSVWDQDRARPLVGAVVYLSGTSFSAVTDSAGSFVMQDLPDGSYTAAFTHPRLDSLAAVSPGVLVQISEGEASQVELEIPTASDVLSRICPGQELEEGTSVLFGTVRDAITGTPLSGATVRVTWSSFDTRDGRTIRENRRGMEIQTDFQGEYAACGVPVGPPLTVQATALNREAQTREVRAWADRPTVAGFSLERRGDRALSPLVPEG